MKLAKLSLAAIVAAGSFSMANAAVSLEEAIKDVEVSGMVRYRLDGDRVKSKGNVKDVKTHQNTNKFRTEIHTKVKFDEYFSGNFGLRFDANDSNGYAKKKGKDVRQTLNAQNVSNTVNVDKNGAFESAETSSSNIAIREVNITYHNEDAATTLIGGRQALDTFYTAGIVGDGVLATNSIVPGVTFAAFYVANLDSKDSDNNLAKYPVIKDNKPVLDTDGNLTTVDFDKPIYGLGVLTNFDFISANLWGVQAKDTATLYGLDAGLDLKLDDTMGVTAKAQVSQTSIDSKIKSVFKDSTNYNVNVGFDMGVFNAKVGYASTGTKKGNSIVTAHDSGSFDYVGEILMDFNMTEGQNQFIYAGIGTQIDAFGAGFEYVNMNTKHEGVSEKDKANEYVGRLSYKYSNKLKFSGYYAFADYKDAAEENKFRLEAKYSF